MIISTKYGFADPFLSDPSDPTSKAQNKLKIRSVCQCCVEDTKLTITGVTL